MMRNACPPFLLALLPLIACQTSERKPPEVSRLIVDLRSIDTDRSGQANLALIRMGEPAVPELVEMLKGEDPRQRNLAAATLWGMGPRGKAAVPALADTLSDRDPALRTSVAMALESMGPEAREAVPALVKVLGDRDTRTRQTAAKALGAIGPAAWEALPALNRATRKVAWPEAEEAIRRIQGR
jgi:HEAT repeat protein